MNEKATETANTAVQKTNNDGLQAVNLNGNLPDLSKAEVSPFDLMGDYWTPETVGESKRVFFDKISSREVADEKTGEAFDLQCAYFIEVVNGEAKTITNGSRRLVGALEANKIQKGMPLLLTYKGKKKNSTNAYQSDSWSIKPLRVAI